MKTIVQTGWLSLVLILGIAFVNALAFQGTRGIYETTEGRYAECAREMMLSGRLSEPVLNGNHHWTKPPLTYLAIIGSIRVFGDSLWGLRAYLVIAMMLTVAAVWWAGVVIWGPKAGFWTGLVTATSPFIVGIANIVATDMLVTLWAALAITAFWHSRARQSRGAAILMWLFLGLGCLTKGPPGVLVPLVLIFCATMFLRRSGTWRPGAWTTLAGVFVFAIAGFGWYAWKAWQYPGLSSYWIGHELIGRNLSDEFNRNPGIIYVFTNYLPILLFGTGPWLALVIIRGWVGRKGPPLSGLPISTWNGAAQWALLVSVILPFVIFSLSRSKLPLYLAPLFVPLCLLVGRAMDILLQQDRLRWRTTATVAGLLILLIVMGKAVAGIPERVRDMTRLADRLAPILARDPSTSLYLVNKRPVNGLEYHLRRNVEFIAPEELGEHMLKQTPPRLHTLYIAKKKDWDRVAAKIPLAVRVEEIGPHWVGIWPVPNQ